MIKISEEKADRLRKYISGLNGITFSEWNFLRNSMDHTISCQESEWKEKSILTINENALKIIGSPFTERVDLMYFYNN